MARGFSNAPGATWPELQAVEKVAQAAKDAATGGADQAYSAEKPYSKGDFCNKDGKLYKCTTAIPAGEAWTPEHWKETTVTEELSALEKGGGGGGGSPALFGFDVNDAGHLIMSYPDGETPPDAHISADGHLIMTL